MIRRLRSTPEANVRSESRGNSPSRRRRFARPGARAASRRCSLKPTTWMPPLLASSDFPRSSRRPTTASCFSRLAAAAVGAEERAATNRLRSCRAPSRGRETRDGVCCWCAWTAQPTPSEAPLLWTNARCPAQCGPPCPARCLHAHAKSRRCPPAAWWDFLPGRSRASGPLHRGNSRRDVVKHAAATSTPTVRPRACQPGTALTSITRHRPSGPNSRSTPARLAPTALANRPGEFDQIGGQFQRLGRSTAADAVPPVERIDTAHAVDARSDDQHPHVVTPVADELLHVEHGPQPDRSAEGALGDGPIDKASDSAAFAAKKGFQDDIPAQGAEILRARR